MEKQKIKLGVVVLIIILSIVVLLMGGYIGYKSFFRNTCKVKTSECKKNEEISETNDVDNNQKPKKGIIDDGQYVVLYDTLALINNDKVYAMASGFARTAWDTLEQDTSINKLYEITELGENNAKVRLFSTGWDPSVTIFVIKDDGKVYSIIYTLKNNSMNFDTKLVDSFKQYNVEDIISVSPDQIDDINYTIYKIKLKNDSIETVKVKW